jgi:hypothetical protein
MLATCPSVYSQKICFDSAVTQIIIECVKDFLDNTTSICVNAISYIILLVLHDYNTFVVWMEHLKDPFEVVIMRYKLKK